MSNSEEAVELEIRRKSQELAVAWRKGRAAFVLDRLSAEDPLRAALISTLIHDALGRWDPYDAKWAGGFRRALLIRSQGGITPDELSELEKEYSRQFGSRPPALITQDPPDEDRALREQVERIRAALTSGRPILRDRRPTSSLFLRPQTVRR